MRIGVTGIFASGKGTVCKMFNDLGGTVIDTDIIAREIVEPGAEGLTAIVEEFGDKFIDSNGNLQRREFANYIFNDQSKVDKLNNITHPIIMKNVIEETSGSEIYFVNTPLLFESKFDKIMDKNIVVTAKVDQAINRGIKRDNISKNEIEARLNHQIPLNEKIKFADYIIDNSGSLENTNRQVKELWKILMQNRKI